MRKLNAISRMAGAVALAGWISGCAAPGAGGSTVRAGGPIAWLADLDAARDQAGAEGKLVLLDFFSPT